MENNMNGKQPENEMETGGLDTGLILEDTYKGLLSTSWLRKTFMRIPKRG